MNVLQNYNTRSNPYPATSSSSSTATQRNVAFPEPFICPLGGSLLCDPVIAMDGYSYERNNILRYFQQERQYGAGAATSSSSTTQQVCYRSPKTGQELPSNFLIANLNLRKAIDYWLATNHNMYTGGGGAGPAGMNPRNPPPINNNFDFAAMPPNCTPVHLQEINAYVVGVPTDEAGVVLDESKKFSEQVLLGHIIDEKHTWRYAWDTVKSGAGKHKLQFECNNWIARRGSPSGAAAAASSTTTAPSSEFSQDQQSLDGLTLLSSRPIRVRFGETMECHVKILEISKQTTWGGMKIGLVPETSTSLLTSENLFQAIDDRGFYFDDQRWFKVPDGGNQLTSFNSAALKENDVLSLFLTNDGKTIHLFVTPGGVVAGGASAGPAQGAYATPRPQQITVEDVNIPLFLEKQFYTSSSSSNNPRLSPSAGGTNLYPFVILSGNCEGVEIGVGRPNDLVLPEGCGLNY
ncbi:unnamed protein product [Amoebophrya sp. A120]|nr:unnamed protein product [Amoebophrya sp. A120]|eukprot:GSA120T00004605001.1